MLSRMPPPPGSSLALLPIYQETLVRSLSLPGLEKGTNSVCRVSTFSLLSDSAPPKSLGWEEPGGQSWTQGRAAGDMLTSDSPAHTHGAL